ncbi:MAG: PKD domain-containing protein, partial [Bacteroidetes bacterium]|nr:PKD domain-containing protein [Bacteroidota bacterium]
MKTHYIKYCIIFTLLLLLVSFKIVFAQLEAKNWYFGNYCGLEFENNQPKVLTNGKLIYNYGGATISDKYGNLLFYTDGQTVWNRNHDTLKNGFGLYSSRTSVQGAIIVPQPGNPTLYYIFTVSGASRPNPGFWYHILDISRDNSKGEVILKNQYICGNMTERLAATFHSDKKSVWIMVHEWNSKIFRAYLLKNSGLDTTPVLSSIGSLHSVSSNGNLGNSVGQLKFSPSGKKMACAIKDDGILEIFDFNNKTGIVSKCIKLKSNRTQGVYGVEFSPNEALLYFSTISPTKSVNQIDLSLGIDSIIKNSIITLKTHSWGHGYYALQTGLDKKIYVARMYSFLGCINNPNVKGTACNYVDTAIVFVSGTKMGLPTFLQSYFYLPDIKIESSCYGDSTTYGLKDTTNIDSVYWVFGDSSFSWLFFPKHVYADTGLYKIQAVIFYDNTRDTFEREIRISNYAYADFSILDTSQCLLGNEFHFYDTSYAVDGAMTYEWDFGDSSGSFQQNPVKTYLLADTFEVKLTVTSSYGCETSIAKKAYVKPMPDALIGVIDSTQCLNENSFFLKPLTGFEDLSGVNYYWHFGDGDTSTLDSVNHIYLNPDTFQINLVAETSFGCRDTTSKEIIVLPSPEAGFSVNDSSQCLNENSFNFTNLSNIIGFQKLLGLNYKWDYGDNTSSSDTSPTKTFSTYDTFNVQLVAISQDGCRDSV